MIQQALKSVPIFRELDDDELAQVLMVGLVRRFAKGATVFKEGEAGRSLYVITEGQVRISKVVPGVGEEALSILPRGDLFGEVEFFDGAPSTANAIAHTDCEVLVIPHREMAGMLGSRPSLAAKFFWAFGRTLAGRLRDSDHRMAALLAMSRGF
jgi:CRP/FNR family transcriptional regulator, cyclic AMP receptor protein